MLSAKNLRQETIDELEAMLGDIRKDLFELKSELKVNRKLEKPHKIKELKKDISRLNTVITEKRLEEKQNNG